MSELRLDEQLQQIVADAKESTGVPALDPINQPMIRHWCDAIVDDNPVYTDPELAAQSSFGEIVAPPTMLQAWTMGGLGARRRMAARAAASDSSRNPMAILDDAGYTSVVATDCEQDYHRYLKLGDVLTVTSRLESISSEKQTALGPGYFVTNLHTHRDQNGEVVAEMRFRILKFKPPSAVG